MVHGLSMPMGGPEVIMDAEEYLQPKLDQQENSTPPPPTPIKEWAEKLEALVSPKFMDDRGFEDPINPSLSESPPALRHRPDKKYAHLEQAMANGSYPRPRENSNNTRYCSDPLKILEMEGDDNAFIHNSATLPKGTTMNGIPHELPVDDDNYLVPSPTMHNNTPTYMDLIGDSKIPDPANFTQKDYSRYIPDFVPVQMNIQPGAVDNLEYHLMNHNQDFVVQALPMPQGDPPQLPQPQGQPGVRKIGGSSDEDTDEHDYYNDYDRLKRELQPLNHRRSETTV